ncbi:MAG: hypothetical protein H0X34_17880 [Chthoniobacterales bacterium]|nr:hypothetical protein [Chthoniobacterales bacterium]
MTTLLIIVGGIAVFIISCAGAYGAIWLFLYCTMAPAPAPAPNPTPDCNVCHLAPGRISDPHCGKVCSDCYLQLINVRSALQELGPLCGLADCAQKRAA